MSEDQILIKKVALGELSPAEAMSIAEENAALYNGSVPEAFVEALMDLGLKLDEPEGIETEEVPVTEETMEMEDVVDESPVEADENVGEEGALELMDESRLEALVDPAISESVESPDIIDEVDEVSYS